MNQNLLLSGKPAQYLFLDTWHDCLLSDQIIGFKCCILEMYFL